MIHLLHMRFFPRSFRLFRRDILCAFTVFAVTALQAQSNSAATPTTDGIPQHPTPEAAAPATTADAGTNAPDKLNAIPLLTLQYQINDIWFRSPPQFPPKLSTTAQIYKGQKIIALFLVGRYAVDADDAIDITYDIDIVYPDGSEQEGFKDAIVYRGKKLPSQGLLLPYSIGGFFAEDSDPTGSYVMKITISDNVSKETLVLESPLEVVDYSVPELPEDFNANRWMTYYYEQPRPQYALPALYALMDGVPVERIDNIVAPMLGFYNRLLADNPWLLPFFAERLQTALNAAESGKQITAADVMLGLLLSYHMRDFKEKPETISDRIWVETEQNRNYDWTMTDPYVSEHIVMPGQLDALWGEFFASGAYAPIRKLAGSTIAPPEGMVRLPEALKKLTPEQREALRSAIVQAAGWSLASNAEQHRLVMAYLSGMPHMEAESMDKDALERVRMILMQAARSRTAEAGQQTQETQSKTTPPGNAAEHAASVHAPAKP